MSHHNEDSQSAIVLESPETLMKRVNELLDSGNSEQALPLLEELCTDTPDDPYLHSVTAAVAGSVQQWMVSMRHAARALELEPDKRDNYHNLALAFMGAGKPSQAVKTYRIAEARGLADETMLSDLAVAIEAEESQNGNATDSNARKSLKIAIFATSDAFIKDITKSLSKSHQVRTLGACSMTEMRQAMEWADVAWFEWCDPLLIQATNHLPKSCKIVCRLHSYEAFTEMPEQVNWSAVDEVVFVNESVRDLVGARIPESVKKTVVHNAVDTDKFVVPSGKKYGKKLAYVGYLNYKKNPQLLLYCFKMIYDWDPEFELHIAGENQDPRIHLYMQDMIRKMNLPVTFHGWQNNVAEFLKDKDFIISTSLFESFHLSIAEGMASGVIPLVHDWFGAGNIYPDEFRFSTPESCLELVKRFMETDRVATGKRVRSVIEDKFAYDKQLQSIESVLQGQASGEIAKTGGDKSENLGLVSIIVPTYNRADLLPEALSSALNQTYPHFEIVVVDDGSTDNTQAVLKQFTDAYPDKICVIRQENKGVSAALNTAIKQSRGEFVSWLSSDDAYHPDKLWENVSYLHGHPDIGWVYSDFFYMTSESRVQNRAHVKGMKPEEFVDRMFEGNSVHGCSVMFRKKNLETVGLFDEQLGGKIGYCADGAMWHKMGYHFKFAFIDKPLVYYRLHPGQVTHQADIPKATADYKRHMQDYFSQVKPGKAPAVITGASHEEMDDSDERLGFDVDPDFPEEKPGGQRILWIGPNDPCGNAAMYARAINKHTPHLCRVVTFKEVRGFDHDIALRRQAWAGDDPGLNELTPRELERIRDLAERADVLVFSASSYAKACVGEHIQDDTDHLIWGNLDWREFSAMKDCVAFFFGSTSTRQNSDWYWNQFANIKKWRIATGQLDLKRRWPDAAYVPTWLDVDAERYRRELKQSDRVLVVQTPTDPPIKNSKELESAVRALAPEYSNLGLAIKTNLSYSEALNLKRQGQIALDQMQTQDGYYCMSSLENSALGLVNFVYLDDFGRKMIAETLKSDKLPWQIVRNESELRQGIKSLLDDPARLFELQKEHYNWMRAEWHPQRLVSYLTDAILK